MQDVPPLSVRRSWRPALSVVVPAYNEAAGLERFNQRLLRALADLGSWEVVYVNDGSTDATLAVVEALHCADDRIAVVSLSRNFGKETAVTAGLDHAVGDAVVVIDADLQDPPEVIRELVACWRAGFDMVYAKRRSRVGDSWLKRSTARMFYRLMQCTGDLKIPPDTGDFRLMSRRVVEAVCQMREQHRFMKGLFAWVGYPTTFVLTTASRGVRAAANGRTGNCGIWRSRGSPASPSCR
jgi:glycosyltransferase involved in cell wall biosynthesis